MADGVEKESIVLNTDNNWKHTFDNLLKKDTSGKDIVYTITEERISGYTTNIEVNENQYNTEKFYIVTNKENPYIPPVPGDSYINISVIKRWEGRVLNSVVINLYADGRKIDSQVVTENMNWRHTFRNLREFDGNRRIFYTVDEDFISGYRVNISGGATQGFVITNTEDTIYIPPTPPFTPEKPIISPVTPTVTPEEPVKPPVVIDDPIVVVEEPVKPVVIVEKPHNVVPKTGDNFNPIMTISILVVSIGLLALTVKRHRRVK